MFFSRTGLVLFGGSKCCKRSFFCGTMCGLSMGFGDKIDSESLVSLVAILASF